MSKIINWKKYYTLKESSEMLDISIDQSADLLISELKARKNTRELKNNNLAHV